MPTLKSKGFTLLEIIISLGLMVMSIMAISRLYATYLQLTANEKFKITASSLANQKIETIRNLPYHKIGTLGGIPAGTILPMEIMNRNGYDYTVSTEVLYIDDPFDGTYNPGQVSNPYDINNPEVIFYWDANSVTNNQSPQKGAGVISTPISLTTASGVIGLGAFFNPGNQSDYARFDVANNIDLTRGRIGFWYQVTNRNISSDRFLFNLNSCTGEFSLKRKNSNKLELRYGQTVGMTPAEYLSTNPIQWELGRWYFIEIVWNSAENEILLLLDNEEIGFRTGDTFNPPTNCSSAFIGNSSIYGTQNADGIIDEIYILNNPFPTNVPQDFLNTDYKRVKVTVSWQTPFGLQSISMLTDVAPVGIESTDGGGTLIINVFNSEGQPVPQASVNITNQEIIPIVDLQLTTDDNGRLLIPGAPASDKYNISVTKTNFSTDATYEPTIDFPTPFRPQVSVIASRSTEVSFAIDLFSTLTIKSVSRDLPGNWEMSNGPTSTPYYEGKIIAGSNVFFNVWQDFRDDLNNPKTFGQSYTFTGDKIWSNDIAIAQAPQQSKADLTIDENDNFYIVWQSNYLGQYDIFINKHNSSGIDLWSGQKKATQNNLSQKIDPQLTYASGTIFVVWQDNRDDTGDIYLNILDQNGNYQIVSDSKINTDLGNAVQSQPKIVADTTNNALVAWLDNRNGLKDIYLTKIDQTGNKLWSSELKVNSEIPSIDHDNFSLTTDQNNNIYITWSDDRTGQANIYWQKIDTDGNKLFFIDQELITQANLAQQTNPKIVCDLNNDLFIAWQDNRGGQQDIFTHKLDSDGNTIWPQEQQINLNSEGDQYLVDTTIYEGTKLALSWTDWHTDYPSVWNATLADQLTENIIPNYDFILSGTKLIYQEPDQLKYLANLKTNSQGELTITNLEWDSYQITNNDTFYNLLMSEPILPFLIPAGTSTMIKLIVN